MGKKQTTRDAESTPELTSSQVIARVLGPRGKNMHEVQFADGRTTLAVLPPRFRNLIWVKRGHYVVLDPEATTAEKLGGEIVHVLFPEHVKDLKSQGQWYAKSDQRAVRVYYILLTGHTRPEEFNDPSNSGTPRDSNVASDEDSDDDLFVNNNRPVLEETESEEDSEEESEDEMDQDMENQS